MSESEMKDLPDSEFELAELIEIEKQRTAGELLILGHHYQRDEIVRFADFIGDSFDLSRKAAESDSGTIIFCGVHFMAESADILTRDNQAVILPNLDASCPMAEMADIGEVESAWIQLGDIIDVEKTLTPVTYINSKASLKAFCGRKDGAVCTSSNAAKILGWAFKQREKVLFFPDQHLGQNTALAMGIKLEEMAIWEPNQPLGGNAPETLRKAKIILWKGNCHVHTLFSVDAIERARREYPDAKIAVHPECRREVVELSDMAGSTTAIIRYVEAATPGSTIVIGTELHLVRRLAAQHSDKVVVPLINSSCPNMMKIGLKDLLFALRDKTRANRVQVPLDIKTDAVKSLNKMLSLA